MTIPGSTMVKPIRSRIEILSKRRKLIKLLDEVRAGQGTVVSAKIQIIDWILEGEDDL